METQNLGKFSILFVVSVGVKMPVPLFYFFENRFHNLPFPSYGSTQSAATLCQRACPSFPRSPHNFPETGGRSSLPLQIEFLIIFLPFCFFKIFP